MVLETAGADPPAKPRSIKVEMALWQRPTITAPATGRLRRLAQKYNKISSSKMWLGNLDSNQD